MWQVCQRRCPRGRVNAHLHSPLSKGPAWPPQRTSNTGVTHPSSPKHPALPVDPPAYPSEAQGMGEDGRECKGCARLQRRCHQGERVWVRGDGCVTPVLVWGQVLWPSAVRPLDGAWVVPEPTGERLSHRRPTLPSASQPIEGAGLPIQGAPPSRNAPTHPAAAPARPTRPSPTAARDERDARSVTRRAARSIATPHDSPPPALASVGATVHAGRPDPLPRPRASCQVRPVCYPLCFLIFFQEIPS